MFFAIDVIAENFQPVFAISGSMEAETYSFELETNKHLLVAATESGHDGSRTCVWLLSEDKHYLRGDHVCSDNPEGDYMETTVSGITKGYYYIKVISTGSWKVWIYKTQ